MNTIKIYTIGHGNTDPEKFLSRLEAALADKMAPLVLDVRSNPTCSWELRYSRNALGALLRERGIAYAWAGDRLGGRPPQRYLYDGRKLNYAACMEHPHFYDGLEACVLQNLKKHDTIVLFCSEGNPYTCHRGKLLTPMLKQFFGFGARHLLPNGDYKDVG